MINGKDNSVDNRVVRMLGEVKEVQSTFIHPYSAACFAAVLEVLEKERMVDWVKEHCDETKCCGKDATCEHVEILIAGLLDEFGSDDYDMASEIVWANIY